MSDTEETKKREGQPDEDEIDGYYVPGTTVIDMAGVIFIGMAIGYSEREIAQMYFWKWSELAKQYKYHHNMIVKKMYYSEV